MSTFKHPNVSGVGACHFKCLQFLSVSVSVGSFQGTDSESVLLLADLSMEHIESTLPVLTRNVTNAWLLISKLSNMTFLFGVSPGFSRSYLSLTLLESMRCLS